jgi:hypothetical protein
MRKMRVKIIALTIVSVVAFFGLLATSSNPSSGQEQRNPTGRTTAHLLCCGRLVSVPGTWFGADRRCAEYLQNAPKGLQTKVCKDLTDSYAFGDLSCREEMASICPELKDAKCEPPRPRQNDPPWFNEDLPCQNRQQATYSFGQNRRNPNLRSVSISICGQVIRYVTTERAGRALPPLGSNKEDVCCDSWQNAVNTGSPCDALRDIDCDGKLNENDSSPLRAPAREESSDDFVINSPRGNLFFWREIYDGMPDQVWCKDCKWELVGVQYTCENKVRGTGRSETIDAEYKYKATWKCPANGSTTVKNGRAVMEGLRCPSPPNQSWP